MEIDVKEINNQGALLFLKKNFEEAKNKYESVLDIDPNNTTTLNNLGLLYLQEQKYKDAENVFFKAYTESENDTYALNLGHSFVYQGNYIEGEKYYLRSIELNKKNLMAWKSLISLYEYSKQHNKAIKALEEVVFNMSHDVFYKIRLAKNLIHVDRCQEALDILYIASQQKDLEFEVFYYKALAHFNDQNFGMARSAIETSIEFKKNWEPSINLAGTICLRLSDTEMAVNYWENILKMNPMNHAVRINKAVLLLGNKKNEKALADIDYVLEHDKQNSKAIYYKGLIYLENKNTIEKGRELLSKLAEGEGMYSEKAKQLINI